jgi:HEAT repeat protein
MDASFDERAAAAADPGRSWEERRVIAMWLMRDGDSRGADLLAAMAADPEFGTFVPDYGEVHPSHAGPARRGAAGTLAKAGDPRGADLFAAMVGDTRLHYFDRHQAAGALEGLGDRRGVDLLAAWAADRDSDVVHRRYAAELLERMGDPRGAELLAALDADPERAELERKWTRHWLAERASDRWLDVADRFKAAFSLVKFGDPRGVEGLAAIAEGEHGLAVWSVTAQLLTDAGAPDKLAGMVVDPRVLHFMGEDLVLDPAARIAAAGRLAELGDIRGAYLLAFMAAEPEPPIPARNAALRRLADVGADCGAPLFAAMASALWEAATGADTAAIDGDHSPVFDA